MSGFDALIDFEEQKLPDDIEDSYFSDENEAESEEDNGEQSECINFNIEDSAFKIDTNKLGPYIEKWKERSGLKLLKPNAVKRACEAKERGLFMLFLTNTFWEAVLGWTNDRLRIRTGKGISMEQFMAYIGVEIAMALHPLNSISDYWSTKPLVGVPDIKNVMSRNLFSKIRGGITFRPPGQDTPDIKSMDPLWHSRSILDTLLSNISHQFFQCAVKTILGNNIYMFVFSDCQ